MDDWSDDDERIDEIRLCTTDLLETAADLLDDGADPQSVISGLLGAAANIYDSMGVSMEVFCSDLQKLTPADFGERMN